MVDRERLDALVDWMVDGARPSASAHQIIDAICKGLMASGVPVDRFALFIYTLHPNIAGRRFTWTPKDGVTMSQGKVGLFSTDEYLHNPLPGVVSSRQPLRRRLADPDCPNDYIIIDELRADGFTDYLAQPLVYTTGETNAASWSSKAPDGFSDEAIAALQRVNPALARLTETYLLRLNAASLLSTYVGHNSGDQILRGRVHRGDGEEIDAAMLFADIVGFTTLSNAMAGPEIVAMLNGTFDLLVPPVETRGGEILKFLGDGFFAIFGLAGGARSAVSAACGAVAEGEAALAASPIGATVSIRSAVHVGRFHYGNVGGANRLDFTAIGAPVNYAARLLAAASALSCPRVISQTAAAELDGAAHQVGELAFKGFSGLHPVYTY
jgi:adenylate cyclase